MESSVDPLLALNVNCRGADGSRCGFWCDEYRVSCQDGGKSNMVQITKTWHCRLFRYWDKSYCLEAGATVKNSSKLAVFGTKNSPRSGILLLTMK